MSAKPRLSNFRLYEAQHNGALFFKRDFDVDERVDGWLEDDAGLLNVNYRPPVTQADIDAALVRLPILAQELLDAFAVRNEILDNFGDTTEIQALIDQLDQERLEKADLVDAGLPQGHANNPDDQTLFYFGYETVFPEPTPLNCVYIGNLSITGAEILVSDTQGVTIGTARQVDDHLYVEFPPSTRTRNYNISVTFPKEGNLGDEAIAILNMTPPFFGGREISDEQCVCYSFGRSYSFAGQTQFQSTQTQRYKQRSNASASKTLSLESMDSHQFNEVASFLDRNDCRLMLLREFDDSSRHNFILGTVNGTNAIQDRGDLNSLQLNAESKFLTQAKIL